MDEREQSKRIKKAIKVMGDWVKKKERAYAENDIEAIKHIKQREDELGRDSIELRREWAKKHGKK